MRPERRPGRRRRGGSRPTTGASAGRRRARGRRGAESRPASSAVDAEMVQLHLRLGPGQRAPRGRRPSRRGACRPGRARSARDDATTVQNAMRAVLPGGTRTRRRRRRRDRAPCRRCSESGRPSITAIGVADVAAAAEEPRPVGLDLRRRPPPRPRRRRDAPPRSRARRASARRRVARSAPTPARYSVCTNSLENAGCAASAAGGASTSSAYEVSSISRARLPVFAIETRRTSASSSAETTTSSVVVIVPSRRTNSARSSVNVTS